MKAQRINMLAAVTAGAVLFLGVATATPARADTIYGGRAFVGSMKVGSSTVATVVDTGELPPSGGSQHVGAVHEFDSLMRADGVFAETRGWSGYAGSDAAAYNVCVAEATPIRLFAWAVQSTAAAFNEGAGGTSDVEELWFGGQQVLVTGAPNQTVTIPGVATLTINEQHVTISGDFRTVTVNALHLTTAAGVDVIIASSRATATGYTNNTVGVTNVPPCGDLISGSGRVTANSSGFASAQGTFTVSVGCDVNGAIHGDLSYYDGTNAVQMASTNIRAYTTDGGHGRHIEGNCSINGVAGFYFQANVDDNSSDGAGPDHFQLLLSTGYNVDSNLIAGDVSLHQG